MLPVIRPTPVPFSNAAAEEDNPYIITPLPDVLQSSIENLQKFSQSSSVGNLVSELALQRRKSKFISKKNC